MVFRHFKKKVYICSQPIDRRKSSDNAGVIAQAPLNRIRSNKLEDTVLLK